MCTVSFIARKNGYALAMNRDEKLSRAIGLPPKLRTVNQRKVLCPSEPGGGTWIALNDCGATFALINWYSITAQVHANSVSRGEVVSAVSAASSPTEAEPAIKQLPLKRINPFRLIGIFPLTGKIIEWQWNLKKLVPQKHRWKPQQWISSGFDEPAAQRIRSQTYRRMREENSFSELDWLRRLHRSHAPECGPFSTCMHRSDAATVSYTEIVVSHHAATMCYLAGTPCKSSTSCSQGFRSPYRGITSSKSSSKRIR